MKSTKVRPKNLYGKSVKETNPNEVWMSRDGTWVWLVLKKWQVDDNAPYARAFCAVYSPATFGSCDLGDTYISEIHDNAIKIEEGLVQHLINLRLGKTVELSIAAAEKVVGHSLTITKVE
jgi:hypothetical protein